MHNSRTTGNRRFRAVALVLIAALFALGPFDEPAGAAKPVFRSTAVGGFTQFSDFPADGVPEVGVVYTTRTILWIGSDSLTALESSEFTFTFDKAGSLIPLSTINAYRRGAGVSFTVDGGLRSASVEGRMSFYECSLEDYPYAEDLQPYSLVDCGDSTGAPIFLGNAVVQLQFNTTSAPEIRFARHGSDTFTCGTFQTIAVELGRTATAVGTLGGDDLGVSRGGYIWKGAATDIYVEHYPRSPQPDCGSVPE